MLIKFYSLTTEKRLWRGRKVRVKQSDGWKQNIWVQMCRDCGNEEINVSEYAQP